MQVKDLLSKFQAETTVNNKFSQKTRIKASGNIFDAGFKSPKFNRGFSQSENPSIKNCIATIFNYFCAALRSS